MFTIPPPVDFCQAEEISLKNFCAYIFTKFSSFSISLTNKNLQNLTNMNKNLHDQFSKIKALKNAVYNNLNYHKPHRGMYF